MRILRLIRHWARYPWSSPGWRVRCWIRRHIGRRLACSCRGICSGHLSRLVNVRILAKPGEDVMIEARYLVDERYTP